MSMGLIGCIMRNDGIMLRFLLLSVSLNFDLAKWHLFLQHNE